MVETVGIRRREFLASAGAGLAGLANLAGGRDAFAGRLDPRPACICLFNSGGMSHIDLWDPKPQAPAGIRGDFRPIETSAPGIYLSELLPQTARLAHKLTIVRGVTHAESDHDRARQLWVAGNCKLQIEETLESSLLMRCEEAGDLERNCREACQQVASGRRFVGIKNGHWDTHSRNSWTLKEILAPAFDRAFSGLIADLDSQGLLSSTLVMVATEFGRSPWINPRGGRDHWPGAFSIVLAGAATAGGQIIGRTDRNGAHPVEGAHYFGIGA